MRKTLGISTVILSVLLMYGCKKEEKPAIPVITTTEVTGISYTTATSGGDVTADGGAPILSRGVCWHTVVNPIVADTKTTETGSTGSFSTNLTHLNPNTVYYVRAYATNISGTGYGDQVSFTTMQTMAPSMSTTSITSFTTTTAVAGGNISNENGAAVTARGVCWSTHPDPTTSDSKTSDGTGPGIFSSTLSGLTANTIYYLKAYATNSEATSYGEVLSFKTFAVDDIDGNGYNSVTIGTQIWLMENLKTTKFNDGTAITPVADKTEWLNLVTPGYCWYNNDEAANKSVYGALYNWYAVNTGKLCPDGWHVPSHTEWIVLSDFLGGDTETYLESSTAGGKLKETGVEHWTSPNVGATNETGFTALPGGMRISTGEFWKINLYGGWWTSTESGTMAYARTINNYRSDLINWGNSASNSKYEGMSVRCLKD